MTQTYNIVFAGETMPEISLEQAQENLARLFRSERQAVERLFGRGEVIIKRSLAETEADKYLSALRQAGVMAYKAAQAVPALGAAVTDHAPPAAAADTTTFAPAAQPMTREAMCCPKCGQSQPKADTCGSCGVVIEKFLALQARQAEQPSANEASPYAPPTAALDENLPQTGELKVWSFAGRIGRLRYIAWSMAMLLCVFGVTLPITGLLAGSELLGSLVLGVGVIAALIVSLMMGAQRLHDIGWTGWLMLLTFVPVVGHILPLVLMIAPGSTVANRYGAPPPPNSTGVKVLAGLFFASIAIGIIAVIVAFSTVASMIR